MSRRFGDMHAVWWDKSGDVLQAASDPRGVGSAQLKRLRPAPEAHPADQVGR
jgi:hypothetical protein